MLSLHCAPPVDLSTYRENPAFCLTPHARVRTSQSIWGIPGALLSVPMVSVTKIVLVRDPSRMSSLRKTVAPISCFLNISQSNFLFSIAYSDYHYPVKSGPCDCAAHVPPRLQLNVRHPSAFWAASILEGHWVSLNEDEDEDAQHLDHITNADHAL